MNKVIVTGGFGALGRAVGEALLAAGAQVALLDQAPAQSSLPAAALHCGGIDLCDPVATRSCIDEVAQQFGGAVTAATYDGYLGFAHVSFIL